MKIAHCVGRDSEFNRLKELITIGGASLVVIKGRRRIGKSRLAEEFAKRSKGFQTIAISAPAPHPKTTALDEREHFARQLGRALNMPPPRADSWDVLFWALAEQVKKGRWIVILDEINWMGLKDPIFLGSLKTAWDQYFSKSPQLIMILSGSLTSWIERNILHDTGFVGRIDLDMTLQELPLSACNEFWGARKNRVSAFDKYRILAVTGGVPKYLESIMPTKSADENIKRLCFRQEGLLFREFDNLFNDLFSKRQHIYRDIIKAIADGYNTMEELHQNLKKKQSGVLSQYIEELIECGFVIRDFTWTIKNGKQSTLSRIRICDNYLRFYIKAVEPRRARIKRSDYDLPNNLDSILGFQFENIVMNNRRAIWESIGINRNDIVMENPFFQKTTQRQKGCQIDYMIQTKQNTLYICELKFKNKPIDRSIIAEVQSKLDKVNMPKNFNLRPILIHVNGVHDAVIEDDYFDEIIDFSEQLN